VSFFILFFTMILNGVFAMAELALVSSRQVRLQQRADNGDRGAAAAVELMLEPNRFISTIQIAITLVGIFAGAFGAAQLSAPLGDIFSQIKFFAPYSDTIAFVILVLMITYFQLVIGELVPKRVALNNPEAIISTLAIPMRYLSKIANPIVNFLSTSSEIGVRLLGIKASNEPIVSEEEIKLLIEQGRQIGVFEEAERDMVTRIFRLGERRVDALMTPRLEMAWIDINVAVDVVWARIKETPHSRIPVADGDLDNILGYIQIRDLLGHTPDESNFSIRPFIKEPIYVPENMPALKALDTIQTSGVHLAVVVDEFGGIMGMVTDYDILESIVGEIPEDSTDTDYLAFQREDGSWLLDGLIVIDQLKDILNLADMPCEERATYQTLSGFVMNELGRIPKTGAKFIHENYQFEVVDMDGRRVDRVLVTKIKDS